MNTLSRLILPLVLLSTFSLSVTGCGGGGGDDSDSTALTPDNNACDIFGLSTRIIAGTQCGGSSPVVRLSISTGGGTAFCTGTMITPSKVLTATHCLSDETFMNAVSASSVTVSLADQTTTAARARRVIISAQASRDLTTIAQEAVNNGEDLESDSFDITKYIEQYGLSDIAVIELDRSLSVPTAQIRTSALPANGEILSIFGYGAINPDIPAATANLYSGEMKLSYTGVKNLFASYDGAGSDTCSGDSGGPILAKEADGTYSIVGTTLGGSERCDVGDVAIFTATAGSGIPEFLAVVAPEATYR